MKQFVITPASGKRLIGKALSTHSVIRRALDSGTIVVIAGTTNGYVAEEILKTIGGSDEFSRHNFFRGITRPSSLSTADIGRLPNESKFPGDVIIVKGIWQKGKTIFDVVDDLREGDVILKGANALDLSRKQAAILIGHPKAGTIGVALQAVIGRRVRLILPVGLEKRVSKDLYALAEKINTSGTKGACLLPVPGQVFTEIDAVSLLTGASAELLAGGGVCGAEGCIWLGISGGSNQEKAAEKLVNSISDESPFS